MDLSIIIVTHNSEKEIGACLRSIFSSSTGLKLELFLVDNASRDKTKAEIAAATYGVTGSNVKTIWNDRNLGFAAAVNQAMRQANGEYILLLNPDAELVAGSLRTWFDKVKTDPSVGIAGAKILNPDGTVQPSVRCFPALLDQFIILTKLYRFFPKLIAKYYCDGFDYDREQEVDQVRGALFLISRALANKIGPLDEQNFFIWFEEVDYCFLAKQAGFKVKYFPLVAAKHVGGTGFADEPPLQKQIWLNRSMRNYFKKRGDKRAYVILSLTSLPSLILAGLVQLLRIKPKKYV